MGQAALRPQANPNTRHVQAQKDWMSTMDHHVGCCNVYMQRTSELDFCRRPQALRCLHWEAEGGLKGP